MLRLLSTIISPQNVLFVAMLSPYFLFAQSTPPASGAHLPVTKSSQPKAFSSPKLTKEIDKTPKQANTAKTPQNTSGTPSNLQQTTKPKHTKTTAATSVFESKDSSMLRIKTIVGNLSPKSVVHNGKGLFFAQNMMYRHTVSVYNREFDLVKTIKDRVKLSDYNIPNTEGWYQGAPVEVAFSHNGQYAWVSNYRMYGKGFSQELGDACMTSKDYENSYLYGINTVTYSIDYMIEVGSVPKYVAVSPNNRYILVSNWCSGDISVIDLDKHKEIRRINIGSHPRGIVIDAQSHYAYIAVMGGSTIGVLDLLDFSISRINKTGITPRHLCLSPDGRYLYATFNNEGKVGKIDLQTRTLISKVSSGRAPRSMVLSGDGSYLYVVNYNDATISKIRTRDMNLLQKIKSPVHPIGITIDADKDQIWVACYSGAIAVYLDRRFGDARPTKTIEPQPIVLPNKQTTQATTGSSSKKPKTTQAVAIKSAKNTPAASSASDKVNSTKSQLEVVPSKSFLSTMEETFWSLLSPKPLPKTTTKLYRIIIASFDDSNKYKIDLFLQQALQKGVSAVVYKEQALGRYRLVSGEYKQRFEAEKALAEVRCIYPDAWIW